jgi:hypothetical protein
LLPARGRSRIQQAVPHVGKRHDRTSYKAENLEVRFLRKASLRYHEKAIAPGAQTKRRGDAGAGWLGGGHAPAALAS